MYTISQWELIKINDGAHEWEQFSHVGNDWQENTLDEAIAAVKTLKVSGRGYRFVIENESGTVVSHIQM